MRGGPSERPDHLGPAATLQAFFDELGERRSSIRAVSIDMSAGYENAVRDSLPDAEVCFDPFHVVALAGRAVDEVRRAEWREHGKSKTAGGRWVKGVRWSLLKAPERQSTRQLAALAEVQQTNRSLYRAFLLKEELRMLYHLPDPSLAPEHLKAWLAWASRSKLKAFVKLGRTVGRYRDGILAAIRLGLSNARLEGLNSKVRLISHRSFGFHGPDPLIALICLCAGGIVIDLPFTPTREENPINGGAETAGPGGLAGGVGADHRGERWPADVGTDARQVLAVVDELDNQARDVVQLSARVDGIQTRLDAFERDAERLVGELAPELAALAGVASVDDLPEVERVSSVAAELRSQLPRLERQITEAGQAPLRELIEHADGVDVDALDAQAAEAEDDLARSQQAVLAPGLISVNDDGVRPLYVARSARPKRGKGRQLRTGRE